MPQYSEFSKKSHPEKIKVNYLIPKKLPAKKISPKPPIGIFGKLYLLDG